MNDELRDLVSFAGLPAVLVAWMQVFKLYIPERFVPLATIVWGALFQVGFRLALGETRAEQIATALIVGTTAGLSAMGFYQVQKPAGWLAPKPE